MVGQYSCAVSIPGNPRGATGNEWVGRSLHAIDLQPEVLVPVDLCWDGDDALVSRWSEVDGTRRMRWTDECVGVSLGGMGRWTNLAWDRSAPRPRGASRPSAPSNPPRISDRTDGSGARSARVESSPACRPPVACRRDAASEEDPPSIHRALNDETRGRGHRGKQQVVVS